MLVQRLAPWLRIPAIALFSVVLASCGSGSGEDSVDVDSDEAAESRLELVFADYFGDPPNQDSRGAGRGIPPAALSAGNWVVDTGYGLNGWGNDEWQRYDNSMDNLFTENGNLVLRAQCSTAPACGKRDGSITSAKVTSKDRINVRYGNIRARIKMPSGIGMWPAFWTLGSDIDERPWPDAGEIDIVEMHYYYSDIYTTHFSTHWAGPRYTAENRPVCASGVSAIAADEEENCKTANIDFNKPLTDGFHVYELDWNESVLVGKIDGITYFTQAIDPATMEEFLKDHYLILNVAVGGTLGGPFGPSMSAADWNNPDKTDMLVDWVEVYERVPATKGTLIDEGGTNLPYTRVFSSIEFGGASVEADLEHRGVEALKGASSMRLKFGTSVSPNGGGATAGFSGAFFGFTNLDLTSYSKLVFSMNTTEFDDFNSVQVEFEDANGGKASVATNTGAVKKIASSGDWNTYEIPLSKFAGVKMSAVAKIGFWNPMDANGNLIAGKLFIDDIRFVGSQKCKAVPTVSFDSINYNPSTNVAAVNVSDVCAANSLALVTVDNGSDDIVVGVSLDSAGNGQGIFNLVGGASVCPTDDSAGIMQLSGNLMAEYNRSKSAKGGSATATAMAGIDSGAPGTALVGDAAYILATDGNVDFIPETDFFFSDFGSGSQFNGAFADSSFNPAFAVSDLANQQAILAMFGFVDGFTSNAESINFKVKNLPGDVIEIKLGQDGGPESAFTVNLNSYAGSTSIGDGWFQVSVPMSEFANPDVYDYVVFASGNSSGSNFTYLITDVFLREGVGSSVPEECGNVVMPPVEGSGTGDTGATAGDFSISFDDPAVTYDFVGFGEPDTISTLSTDPLKGSNMVVQTTKLNGSQVWAGVTVTTTPGITFPLTNADSVATIRIYSPGPGLVVRMKMEDSADENKAVQTDATTTVTTGWETLTFDFSNPAAGTAAINPAYTYDKLSLFFGFGTPGDGTTYTWDTVEFEGTIVLPGGNLASNGDFEEGDLSGWTSNPGNGSNSAVDDQDSGSTWSGRISTIPANGAALAQTNLAVGVVQPGDTIDIAFDMCGTLEGIEGEFRPGLLSEFGMGVGAFRQDLQNFTSLPSVWTRYNFQAIAGDNVDGGISLQFDAVCGGSPSCGVEAFIDNVSITIGGGMVAGTASGQTCESGGGPGGDLEDAYIFATDPNITPELEPTIDNFGSGAVFDDMFGGDDDFNPAFQVTSGEGYGANVHVGFVAFNGLDAGFADGYEALRFKVKGLPAGSIEVKFINGGDTSVVYDVSDADVALDIGNGWYQMVIPLSDFSGTIANNSGLLLGPLGDQGAPFSFLMTDIYLSEDDSLGGGGGPGGDEDSYIFATDQNITPDLVPAAIENFGSGAVFNDMFMGDARFDPAYQVTSGEGYGANVHVGFVAFNGFEVGFAKDFKTLRFKVKDLPAGSIEVKFINGGDTSVVYDVSNGDIATDIGDGWYEMVIPLTDFAATIAANSGLLLGPLGDQGAAFSFLMTDIRFSDSDVGGGGGGDGGIESYIYATDAGITPDLVPAAIENFGSGAVFDDMFSGDGDFNPAFQTVSGEGYGANVHVGFVAFNGLPAGFAKDFETLHFKVKGLPANSIEVKFINGGDTSVVYDVSTYANSTDIGNGWFEVEIPIDDFAATVDSNSGLLLGPLGDQGAAFSFLLTDIGFSGDRDGGGGGGGGSGNPGDELVSNGEFEAGDALESWLAITDPNGGTIVAESVTVSPNNGSTMSIKMTSGPDNNPVLKQERFGTGSISPNQAVTVSFDLFGSLSGVGGVFIAELISEIDAGGVSKAETLSGAPLFPVPGKDWTSGWVTYSFPTTLGDIVDGGISMQFVAIGGAGSLTMHVDNVSIVID